MPGNTHSSRVAVCWHGSDQQYRQHENYSDLVLMVDATEDKLRFLDFASQESKHIRMLAKLGKRLDFRVEQRIVEPEWHALRSHFHEAAERRAFTSCILIQDVMVETMAVALYQTLAGMRDAETDPATAQVASRILADEYEHLDYGVDQVRQHLERDRKATEDALVWAHHRVMPQLYGLSNYGVILHHRRGMDNMPIGPNP